MYAGRSLVPSHTQITHTYVHKQGRKGDIIVERMEALSGSVDSAVHFSDSLFPLMLFYFFPSWRTCDVPCRAVHDNGIRPYDGRFRWHTYTHTLTLSQYANNMAATHTLTHTVLNKWILTAFSHTCTQRAELSGPLPLCHKGVVSISCKQEASVTPINLLSI